MDQRHAHDASAPPFHFLRPDDRLRRVIGTLHQHVGPEPANQRERRVLVEQHHAVDGRERRHEPGALALGDHGPVGPFAQTAGGRVAVDADNEGVAFGAGRFEQRDVARMEQVKDAVGENDPALRRAPGGGGLERTELRRGVQSGWVALGWKEML